jgi:hypothetical protein
MTDQKRFLYTKIIVIGSVLISLLSFVTQIYFYPFFHYKLYTQPLGFKNSSTEYRIYSQTDSSDLFIRNPIKPTSTYDYESYLYTFNFLISEIENSKGDRLFFYKRKLLKFCKEVVPGQKQYKIVSETYHPLDLKNEKVKYDTTTIINF